MRPALRPWRRRLAGPMVLAALLSLAPAAGETPPAWVERLPHRPGQYLGIGRADKLREPMRYRELAQAEALARLGREISASIRAEDASSVTERDGVRDERYARTVTASSRAELAGYELAGVYETESELWVMYALDKETFRQGLDARDRAFGASLEGPEAELRAGRLQGAVDALEAAQCRYAAAYPPQALPGEGTEAVRRRYERLVQRVGEAAREARLETEGTPWTLDLRPGRAGAPAAGAVVRLVDGRTGERWAGRLRISIAAAGPQGRACEAETDAQGRMGLARAFLGCGLPPGAWTLAWDRSGASPARLEVEAVLIKPHVTLHVEARGGPDAEAACAQLLAELAALESPYFQVARGRDSLPALTICLGKVAVDSLEGLYFTSIQGQVRYPGAQETVAIQGKAGHTDKERSRYRAVRDLAREITLSGVPHVQPGEEPWKRKP